METKVYIFTYDEATDRPNICYLKGDRSSLLIDAGGGPKTKEYLLKEFAKHNLDLPKQILLTHYHWDHSFGIGHMDGLVYASKYTNDKLKEHMNLKPTTVDDIIADHLQPEFCREHLNIEYPDFSAFKLREVDHIINDYELDLGNRIIDIMKVPSPHTEGSLVAFDRNSKYLFIGDADCGYIKGMDFYDDVLKERQFLDHIVSLPFEYVVRGHSAIETREEYFKAFEV